MYLDKSVPSEPVGAKRSPVELQPITKDNWSIGRPIIADESSWFKGKDVAASLEYANPRDALHRHVDPEDKTTFSELTKGVVNPDTLSNQQPHEVYINESGLYCLAFRSNKPEAKTFKRWVTSEVLPSIRKYGGYGGGVVAELTEQAKELRTAMTALTQRLDAQSQSQVQNKVLTVANPQGPRAEQDLLARGTILTTEQVEDLNASTGVIKICDWLHERISSRNRSSVRKITDLFTKALKKARLIQAENEEIDVPLLGTQGGHRIVYTTCDEDLMSTVFDDLKDKLHKIIELDEKLSENHASKAGTRRINSSIEPFLKPTNAKRGRRD